MIRIRVVAVGKLKEKYWTDAVNEYLKRLSRYARVEVTECPEGVLDQSPAANKKQEAEGILSKCKGYVVLTDSRGEQLASEEFAKMLDRESARGASEFTFVIGGSHGVDESVYARADKTVSFGKVTYPHQLMRVILLEQLYRAETIINGNAYHK